MSVWVCMKCDLILSSIFISEHFLRALWLLTTKNYRQYFLCSYVLASCLPYSNILHYMWYSNWYMICNGSALKLQFKTYIFKRDNIYLFIFIIWPVSNWHYCLLVCTQCSGIALKGLFDVCHKALILHWLQLQSTFICLNKTLILRQMSLLWPKFY